MGGWIKRNLALVMAAALLVVTGAGAVATTSAREGELEAAREAVAAAEAELVVSKSAAQSALDTGMSEVGGFSPARVTQDEAVIADLMRRAVTWTSAQSYEAAREEILRLYPTLDETSQFMTTFLPGEAEGAYRRDASGALHFAFANVNSSLGTINAQLINVVADEYTYFARVGVTSISKDGKGSSTRDASVIYTVSATGEITNISAFASPEAPTVSGVR